MSNIAVFGGAGTVGKFVVEGLQHFGHQVTSIGRKRRPELINYQVVDVFDQEATKKTCSQFDVIVNAAGPSNIILDRIASIALSQGVPYVDVSGEPELYDALIKDHEQCSVPCVIGAGFVPGFASLLAIIAHRKIDVLNELKIFVGGVEVFTPTSAQDFVASIGANDAITGSGIVNGKITRITPFNYKPCKDAPDFLALPYLSAEHQRVAADLGIDNYQAFNLVADKNMLSLGQIESERAIELLVSESKALTERYGTQQFCIFEARGLIASQPSSLRLHGCSSDGYRLTGWMSAIAAHQLTVSKQKNGIQWLSDMIDIDACLIYLEKFQLFKDWDFSLTTDITSNFSADCDDIEEGEL